MKKSLALTCFCFLNIFSQQVLAEDVDLGMILDLRIESDDDGREKVFVWAKNAEGEGSIRVILQQDEDKYRQIFDRCVQLISTRISAQILTKPLILTFSADDSSITSEEDFLGKTKTITVGKNFKCDLGISI